jgi:hypothetical protein
MTPRSIRRAAERRDNKLARKAAQQSTPAGMHVAEDPALENLADENEISVQESPAIPPAAAANAGLSAVISALTGHATLLPASDTAPYDQVLRDYQNELQPVGLQESNLVETLAETAWRIRRSLALEMGIFAKGRIEFAQQFAEHNPEIRAPLIEVHTFLTYEKQIHSLQLQEARLSRRIDKAYAELRRLQAERREREKADRQRQLEAAAQLYLKAQQTRQPFDAGQNGFVFSNEEIESYLNRKQALKKHFASSAEPVSSAS